METNKRYFILLVTTFSSLLVIVLAELALTNFAVYHRPSGHVLVVLSGSLITIFAMLAGEPFLAFLGKPQVGLQVNATIWLLYTLDIGSLIYLITTTGGLTQSPYVAFLMLLPTNGILMAQSFKTVALYYCGVGAVGVLLGLLPEPQTLLGNGPLVHKCVHLGVFIFVFIIALLAYWLKESPARLASDPSVPHSP